MNRVQRLFALRSSPAFAHLYDSELAAVAGIATVRRVAPGAYLVHRGQAVRHLYVVAEGGLVDDEGREVAGPCGAREMLCGRSAPRDLLGHPRSGATCLLIGRTHFLTLVSEFPAVLLDMHAAGPGREAHTP